ncbi:OLC1v1000364C2 [Oldenlandia corymbosa var. corymbosa]|uniref:OLC1v1000364C2 n=1 Tax=Oldenlandia corymbosa var. corymbosa TaxID=529605 RepID=A0AAV1D3H7_OLDCO|nr:OLC1v1000364C2 [Oldenlandia corymbosa var. corymbosa]
MQKWILKVSIHCEGCKRKVKKLLHQVEGVYDSEIDTKQQKVTVIGNVDANTLLRKLNKAGKHAELWPENPNQKEKKSAASAKKEKVVPPQEGTSQNSNANNVKEVKTPPVKAEISAQEVPKESQGGGGVKNGNGGEVGAPAKVGGAVNKVEESGGGGNSNSKSISGDNEPAKELNKSEGKKPEIESVPGDGAQPPPPKVAAEEKDGGGGGEKSTAVGKVGGGNDGSSVKKKKKKGQSVNNQKASEPQQQSGAAAQNEGSRNHQDGTQDFPFPDHHSRPRHPMYDHYPTHQFYGPPGPAAPPPIYATVSYNTAQPTSSYTASYYAPPPPNSYVYSYPGGPQYQPPPPPSDFDPYSTRQPLDSFEMFSDENPNGCLIM